MRELCECSPTLCYFVERNEEEKNIEKSKTNALVTLIRLAESKIQCHVSFLNIAYFVFIIQFPLTIVLRSVSDVAMLHYHFLFVGKRKRYGKEFMLVCIQPVSLPAQHTFLNTRTGSMEIMNLMRTEAQFTLPCVVFDAHSLMDDDFLKRRSKKPCDHVQSQCPLNRK